MKPNSRFKNSIFEWNFTAKNRIVRMVRSSVFWKHYFLTMVTLMYHHFYNFLMFVEWLLESQYLSLQLCPATLIMLQFENLIDQLFIWTTKFFKKNSKLKVHTKSYWKKIRKGFFTEYVANTNNVFEKGQSCFSPGKK